MNRREVSEHGRDRSAVGLAAGRRPLEQQLQRGLVPLVGLDHLLLTPGSLRGVAGSSLRLVDDGRYRNFRRCRRRQFCRLRATFIF